MGVQLKAIQQLRSSLRAVELLPSWIFGLRSGAILETLVYLALALAIDTVFLDGTRFRAVNPHPFWVIVLLVTVQYGANEGLLAAVLSSAALLSGQIPAQTMGEDLHGWFLRVALLPVLWCGAAFLLGQFSRRQIADRDRLSSELAATRANSEVLADHISSLTAAKSELEERISRQQRTLSTVVGCARAIMRPTRAEVAAGVDELVPALFGTQRFSLFLLTNFGLVAAKSLVGPDPSQSARTWPSYTPQTALYRAVVEGKRTLAIVRPDDAALLDGDGVLAGPLVASGDDEVLGMLRIDEISFAGLNSAALLDFDVVCTWIGDALVAAGRYEGLPAVGNMVAADVDQRVAL